MLSIAALCVSVVVFFSLCLFVPVGAAAIVGDWVSVEAIGLVGVGYAFFAVMAYWALAPRLRQLNRAGIFTASIAMWLTLVVISMPLFMLVEQMHPIEALFEASSAAMTLGVSFHPPTDVHTAMAVYRGMIAWQGGLLTLVLAVYVLGQYRVGGVENRQLRFVLHSVHQGDPRIAQTFAEVFVPYLAATLVCTALLVLTRMPVDDAFHVAINVISTNGYLPMQSGASVLNNLVAETVMIVFMVFGATSILWHRALVTRRWSHAVDQKENTTYLIALIVLAVVAAFVAASTPSEQFSPAQAAFNRVFDVVSVFTTTGITHDQRFGVGFPFELMLAMAVIGGCAYSTAGGLKVFRLANMLHHSINEVRRLVYPHAMLVESVDVDRQELATAKAVWSAFYVAIVTILGATIAFSIQGVDLAASLGLSIGSFSSTGNLVTTSLDMAEQSTPSGSIMLIISAVGLAARIEFLIILAAFSRNDW